LVSARATCAFSKDAYPGPTRKTLTINDPDKSLHEEN
jgi:hypothetical protein